MSTRLVVLRLFLTLLLGFGCNIYRTATAEEGQPTAEEKPTEDAKAPEAAEETVDEFAVPDGSTKELLDFITEIDKKPVPRTSRAELISFLKRASSAKIEAADKLLSMQPDEKSRAIALNAKFDAYGRLTMMGQSESLDALKKLAEELKNDSDQALAAKAQGIILQMRVRDLRKDNWSDADAVLADTSKYLEANVNDMTAASTAFGVAQALEQMPTGNALALQAYKSFGKTLAGSSNPSVSKLANKFDGVVRRLELLGNSMVIEGPLLDGSAFDQAKFSGKVVLVDFWATWCGPCVAELPNVLDNYKKYHDKGFEVVGISLDNSKEALEKFMKAREIPWEVIFEDTAEGRGWNNSIAQKYGVMGIPTVILIGKDGNVISLNARGPMLGQLLAEQLGPIETEDEPKAAEEKSDSDN